MAGSFVVALSACGSGHVSPAPPSPKFKLQACYVNLVNMGLTTNVALSGTNAISTPFSGTGTLTLAAAVSASFNNSPALSQSETISGTVTAAGQSAPYISTVVGYYAAGSGAVLGQSTNSEYDVVQSPFTYPTSVIGGSSGI